MYSYLNIVFFDKILPNHHEAPEQGRKGRFNGGGQRGGDYKITFL